MVSSFFSLPHLPFSHLPLSAAKASGAAMNAASSALNTIFMLISVLVLVVSGVGGARHCEHRAPELIRNYF
jgi:hypothetical protein